MQIIRKKPVKNFHYVYTESSIFGSIQSTFCRFNQHNFFIIDLNFSKLCINHAKDISLMCAKNEIKMLDSYEDINLFLPCYIFSLHLMAWQYFINAQICILFCNSEHLIYVSRYEQASSNPLQPFSNILCGHLGNIVLSEQIVQKNG